MLSGYEKKWPELPAKWTPPENLHITLVFLGDLTDIELGQVCMTVKDIAKNHNSFNITLNKIAYGPAEKIPPRYIWAGGEKGEELSLLKKDLEDALLEVVHFVPDKGAFSPHITLARIGAFAWRAIDPEERPEVNENIDLIFTVESIDVMESESKRGQDARASHKMGAPVSGPHYTIIESHQLQ